MAFMILNNRAYYQGPTISWWNRIIVSIWNFFGCKILGHEIIGWVSEEDCCSCCMHCSFQLHKCEVHDKEM